MMGCWGLLRMLWDWWGVMTVGRYKSYEIT